MQIDAGKVEFRRQIRIVESAQRHFSPQFFPVKNICRASRNQIVRADHRFRYETVIQQLLQGGG